MPIKAAPAAYCLQLSHHSRVQHSFRRQEFNRRYFYDRPDRRLDSDRRRMLVAFEEDLV